MSSGDEPAFESLRDRSDDILDSVELGKYFEEIIETIREPVEYSDEDEDARADARDETRDLKRQTAAEVMEWLPDIWQAAISEPKERERAYKCLCVAYKTIFDLEIEDNYRGFERQLKLKNCAGEVIHEYAEDEWEAITWVLAELLLATLAASDVDSLKLVDTILSDADRHVTLEEIKDSLRRADGPIENKPDHWSQGMYEAVPKLLSLIEDHRIKQFLNSPTFEDYVRLEKSVNNNSTFLEALRKHFLDNETPPSLPSKSWSEAFRILSQAGKADDIVRFLTAMPEARAVRDLEETRINAVTYLLKRMPQYSSKGLQSVKEGLTVAKSEFWQDLRDCFPNLDAACASVKEQMVEGKIERYGPPPRRKDEMRHRVNGLRAYVDMAVGSKRPRAEAAREATGLDTGDKLRLWAACLVGRGEAGATLRKEVFATDMAHPLFNDCGDFYEVLAACCDPSNPGSFRRPTTAKALHEAGELFARPKPKPPPVAGQKRPHDGNDQTGQSSGGHGGKKQKQGNVEAGKPNGGQGGKQQNQKQSKKEKQKQKQKQDMDFLRGGALHIGHS